MKFEEVKESKQHQRETRAGHAGTPVPDTRLTLAAVTSGPRTLASSEPSGPARAPRFTPNLITSRQPAGLTGPTRSNLLCHPACSLTDTAARKYHNRVRFLRTDIWRSKTHTHSFSLSLSLFLSISHTHTYTLFLSLSLSLSHTHTHTPGGKPLISCFISHRFKMCV